MKKLHVIGTILVTCLAIGCSKRAASKDDIIKGGAGSGGPLGTNGNPKGCAVLKLASENLLATAEGKSSSQMDHAKIAAVNADQPIQNSLVQVVEVYDTSDASKNSVVKVASTLVDTKSCAVVSFATASLSEKVVGSDPCDYLKAAERASPSAPVPPTKGLDILSTAITEYSWNGVKSQSIWTSVNGFPTAEVLRFFRSSTDGSVTLIFYLVNRNSCSTKVMFENVNLQDIKLSLKNETDILKTAATTPNPPNKRSVGSGRSISLFQFENPED